MVNPPLRRSVFYRKHRGKLQETERRPKQYRKTAENKGNRKEIERIPKQSTHTHKNRPDVYRVRFVGVFEAFCERQMRQAWEMGIPLDEALER